jgi:hypothetical protein
LLRSRVSGPCMHGAGLSRSYRAQFLVRFYRRMFENISLNHGM